MKKNTLEKRLAKLNRKRLTVLEWLNSQGFELDETVPHERVVGYAYKLLGIKGVQGKFILPSLHAKYSTIIGRAELWRKPSSQNVHVPKAKSKAKKDNTAKFYRSYEWKKLRYEIIQRDGGRCVACGASPETGAVLNVDHIKPLRKFWSLRLDPGNLQTLCGACNHGKGNWDQTDWRAPAHKLRKNG